MTTRPENGDARGDSRYSLADRGEKTHRMKRLKFGARIHYRIALFAALLAAAPVPFWSGMGTANAAADCSAGQTATADNQQAFVDVGEGATATFVCITS